MEYENTISRERAIWLTFGSASGSIIYTFAWVITITGKPFWIAVLIGVLLDIPFALWILYLGKYKQGATIFDILEMGLGKFVTGIMIIMYIILNIAAAVSMLNLFTGTIKVFFLQQTPVGVIMFCIVLMSAIFAESGIATFGWLVEITAVLCILTYFGCFAVSFIDSFKIEYIFPILDASFSQFAKGIIVSAGITGECLLFFMVMVGSMPHPKKHCSWVVIGLSIWSVTLSSAILIMGGIVSPELLVRVAQAGVGVGRVIQIGDFIRGLEILVLLTYQCCTITKTLIYGYSCWVSAAKIFNGRYKRFLLVLVTMMILISSVWVNSYNTGYFLSVFLGSYIILPFVSAILVLATLSVFIEKKRNGRTAK